MGTGHLGSLGQTQDADNIKVLAVSMFYQRRLTRAKNMCQGDGYLDPALDRKISTPCSLPHPTMAWQNLLRCMDSANMSMSKSHDAHGEAKPLNCAIA